MNEVTIFSNPAFGDIRTAGTSEEPLFCLADVCKTLDLQAAAVARRLEKDVISSHPLQTAGGIQQLKFVNEDGLYDVILDSRKPEAKAFRKWVTSEVLPSIRKTGKYDVQQQYQIPSSFSEALMLAAKQAEQIEAQQKQLAAAETANKQLTCKVNEMKEKVSYLDQILSNKSTVVITQIAQDYGMSAIAFNKLLERLKIQHKMGSQWILYAQFLENGYVHSKTIEIPTGGTTLVKMHTEWTQKGRIFLYDQLKQNGIVPLIERN
jgi:anti-repressor protein